MFSLAQYWNEITTKVNNNPPKRDYCYASEIGYPIVDRYLKMLGVEYTNPPNNRSLRKFWTGNFFEEAVEKVLLTAGLLQERELKVDASPYPDTLDVHGRLDFIAGGYIDPEKIMHEASKNRVSAFLQPIVENYIEKFGGTTVPETVLEIKSVSMYAYEYVEKKRKPMDAHAAQAYHYKKHTNLPAMICYISKDTSMMAEFEVEDNVGRAYRDDLLKITHYYNKRQTPPLEPLLFFDPAMAKFSKNLGVEYSNYLTMLYGYKSPDEYRRSIEPSVKRWNNALTRWAAAETGATTPTGRPIALTPANKDALKEIKASGYDLNDILRQKLEMMDIDETAEIE